MMAVNNVYSGGPVSCNNKKYLLIIQDYWTEAIPLHDQTALSITISLSSYFSDLKFWTLCIQIKVEIKQTLQAFGVSKKRT